MATVTPTRVVETGQDRIMHVWEGFAASADVGTAVEYGSWRDRTVQVLGTFTGSLEITIEGSNDGGTTWFPLTKTSDGTSIALTAAGGCGINEVAKLIRPRATAGSGGGDADVYLYVLGK